MVREDVQARLLVQDDELVGDGVPGEPGGGHREAEPGARGGRRRGDTRGALGAEARLRPVQDGHAARVLGGALVLAGRADDQVVEAVAVQVAARDRLSEAVAGLGGAGYALAGLAQQLDLALGDGGVGADAVGRAVLDGDVSGAFLAVDGAVGDAGDEVGVAVAVEVVVAVDGGGAAGDAREGGGCGEDARARRSRKEAAATAAEPAVRRVVRAVKLMSVSPLDA